jgi:gliding motility-associated protein GldM
MKKIFIIVFLLAVFFSSCQNKKKQNEVINPFELVHESIKLSNENFQRKTKSLYSKLDSLNLQNPEKFGEPYNTALIAKGMANALVNQIERFKQEIITKADCVPYNPDEKQKVSEIKNKDDLNVASDLMMEERGPSKGDSLKAWVDEYRAFILSNIEDTSIAIYSNIQIALSTETEMSDVEHEEGSHNIRTWQDKLFSGMPLVGTIAMLTKLQTDIRNAETDFVEYLIIVVEEED